MTKTIDQYFRDWEGYAFGYGYGTGEHFIIPCLKRFLDLCPKYGDGAYDHELLTKELGGPVTWFLINRFCQLDLIEYGTSPRHGWLTALGTRLKEYVSAKTAEELIDSVCMREDEEYFPCYPDACNCGPTGYEESRVCQNPFWNKKAAGPEGTGG